MTILITGGAGYIGSHTVVELMAAGHETFIIDNLCNSKASVLDRIERITGRRPGFAQLDVRDRPALRRGWQAQLGIEANAGTVRRGTLLPAAARRVVSSLALRPAERQCLRPPSRL